MQSKRRLVYLPEKGHKKYARWLPGDFVITETRANADLILFTGGSDVSPSFYQTGSHPKTSAYHERDRREADIFTDLHNAKIPMLGICRGSQFLTVMNGGQLIQHVTNHNVGPHPIQMFDGSVINMTSTHHQMHWPYDLPDEVYRILGWADRQSTTYEGANCSKISIPPHFVESEIIYFPYSRCLGIQGHPEHYSVEDATVSKMRQLLEAFLADRL